VKEKTILIVSLALIAGLFCFIACTRSDKTKNPSNDDPNASADIEEQNHYTEEAENIDSTEGQVTDTTEGSINSTTGISVTSDKAAVLENPDEESGDKTSDTAAELENSDNTGTNKDSDKQQTNTDTKPDSKKDDSKTPSTQGDSKNDDSQTQTQSVDKPVDNTVLTVDMDEVDDKCKYYTKELKDLAYTVLKSLYIKDHTAFYSYPEVVEPYHLSVKIELFHFNGIGDDTVFFYQSDAGWRGGTPYDNSKRDVKLNVKYDKPLAEYSAVLEIRVFDLNTSHYQIYDVMWRDTGEYSFLSEEGYD